MTRIKWKDSSMKTGISLIAYLMIFLPTVTGKNGLRTLQISHAILKSHQEKRVVRIDEFGGRLHG